MLLLPQRSGEARRAMPNGPRSRIHRYREQQAMAFVFDTVPANRGLIDMDNPREVAWWTKRFACNESQLREAVEQVGPNAAQVEQLLDGQEYILTV